MSNSKKRERSMKKVICIVLVAVFGISLLSAQVKIGPRVGLNVTNVKGDDDDNDYPKNGYNVGAQAIINFTENFGLQPALMLSTKGCIVKSNGFKVTGNFNYLEVPVNLYYGFKIGKTELQVIAGAYFAYLMSGKSKCLEAPAGFTMPDRTFKRTYFATLADQQDPKVAFFTPLDYGLNIGVGFLAMEKIQAQFNFGYGLANILPEFEARQYERDHHTNIQVSVVYLFGGE